MSWTGRTPPIRFDPDILELFGRSESCELQETTGNVVLRSVVEALEEPCPPAPAIRSTAWRLHHQTRVHLQLGSTIAQFLTRKREYIFIEFGNPSNSVLRVSERLPNRFPQEVFQRNIRRNIRRGSGGISFRKATSDQKLLTVVKLLLEAYLLSFESICS